MPSIPRHKVFVSFHNRDKKYKDAFVKMMNHHFVDRSVGDGDIDTSRKTQAVRQIIRDDFIQDATVTVVLIGKCTWQRKHVDWEIAGSLRQTEANSRCGLLGVILPTHSNFDSKKINKKLLPPRLADNLLGKNPFALVIKWRKDPRFIRQHIHKAFYRKDGHPPTNKRTHFGQNRGGNCLEGWKD